MNLNTRVMSVETPFSRMKRKKNEFPEWPLSIARIYLFYYIYEIKKKIYMKKKLPKFDVAIFSNKS